MKKSGHPLLVALSLLTAFSLPNRATGMEPPPIETVIIGPHREFRVNGQPFLPIMGWLQAPKNFPKLTDVGINTIAGYHWNEQRQTGPGGTKNAAEYGRLGCISCRRSCRIIPRSCRR